jgi:hypothetical protein
MRKIALLLILALAGVATWYFLVTKKKPKDETPTLQAETVSKHSDSFNLSVNKALTTYYALSESFVNWDSTAVNKQTDSLKSFLGNIHFDDLKDDTSIYQTAVTYQGTFTNDIENIRQQADITAKRRAYNSLSQNMYDLLRVVKYDGGKVFLQECPMAFNDTESALWLSQYGADEKRRNPYLGLYHPKYKDGMLTCGETKDSLYFKQTSLK